MASEQLMWNRNCWVAFGPRNQDAILTITSGMSVAFDIDKDPSRIANPAKIIIRNLSKESRQKLTHYDDMVVVVYVGYGLENPDMSILFIGDVTYISSNKKTDTWETEIHSGDGRKATQAKVTPQNFPKGTTYLQQAEKVIKDSFTGMAMGLMQGITKGVNVKGMTVEGLANDLLGNMAESQESDYSIQNGTVQVVDFDLDDGNEAVVINPTSGLVGAPQVTRHLLTARGADGKAIKGADKKAVKKVVIGLEFECLINPEIYPGRAVHLTSELYDGFYKVVKVKFTGDLSGNAWYAKCNCLPMKAQS